MKAGSGIKHYASRQEYLDRSPSKLPQAKKLKDGALSQGQVSDKVKISESAKQKNLDLKEIPRKIEDKAKETASAVKKLGSEGASSLKSMVKMTPYLRHLPLGGSDGNEAVDGAEAGEVKKIESTLKDKTLNRPGLFFIRDFNLNPFSSDDFGLSSMAEQFPSGELLGWDQEDELVEKIMQRPHHQPIVLIGHGMGGDTIVNVANRLNTIDHGFRKINLAITLNSVGFDNDIIPQNVTENLNMISEEQGFWSDGPNIARKKFLTTVTNELRPESHEEMDESPEVQFMIFERINSVLGDSFVEKNREFARLKSINDMNPENASETNP